MARYLSLALVLLVGLPAASVAGCGEDEESTPTRQEFIAEAHPICRAAEQDLTAKSRDLGFYTPDGVDGEEAEFIEEEVIPFYQGQVDGIRELTPPPGEEERLEAALSEAERGIEGLREDPLSFAPPIGPDGERITTSPKGWVELGRLLRGYGRGPCGN